MSSGKVALLCVVILAVVCFGHSLFDGASGWVSSKLRSANLAYNNVLLKYEPLVGRELVKPSKEFWIDDYIWLKVIPLLTIILVIAIPFSLALWDMPRRWKEFQREMKRKHGIDV